MTDLEQGVSAASDAALISRARLGDRPAYDALASRHRPAIRTLAALLDAAATERLVDDALDLGYRTLRRMCGPLAGMRTHLLLAARRLSESPVREVLPVDVVPFRDLQGSELHTAVGDRFAGLPEAWQAAVWHLEAERESATQAARMLGLMPSAVRPLVLSAHHELRAELLRHEEGSVPPSCAGHMLRLARGRSPVPPRSVLRHAAGCERCVVLVADLDIVERDLAGTLARHLLGPVADAYLDVRRAMAGTPG